MSISGIVEKVSLMDVYSRALELGLFQGSYASYLKYLNMTEYMVIFDQPIALDGGGKLGGACITPDTIGRESVGEGDRVIVHDFKIRRNEATVSRVTAVCAPAARPCVHHKLQDHRP
jgi:hypothetical protein